MNGVLVVYKPKGYTSRDVVNVVSKALGTKKVGHIGTLDPLATGVLVLCVGKCLKLVELLTNHDKEYIAHIRLGFETDTLDLEGNVVKRKSVPQLKEEDIKRVLASFLGKIHQVVPLYSSIKVNGKKLYDYARQGVKVELPSRDVFVYGLELVQIVSSCEFVIKCHVSRGTYIRSLVRDIGYALGTVATMVDLERISLGKFSLEDAYSLDDILSGNYRLISPVAALDLKTVVVDLEMEKRVKNGQVLKSFFDEDMVFLVNRSGDVLAIYQQIEGGYVKPYRMF